MLAAEVGVDFSAVAGVGVRGVGLGVGEVTTKAMPGSELQDAAATPAAVTAALPAAVTAAWMGCACAAAARASSELLQEEERLVLLFFGVENALLGEAGGVNRFMTLQDPTTCPTTERLPMLAKRAARLKGVRGV